MNCFRYAPIAAVVVIAFALSGCKVDCVFYWQGDRALELSPFQTLAPTVDSKSGGDTPEIPSKECGEACGGLNGLCGVNGIAPCPNCLDKKCGSRTCGDDCDVSNPLSLHYKPCDSSTNCSACISGKCSSRGCGMDCGDSTPCTKSSSCPNCIGGKCGQRACGEVCSALKTCGNATCPECVDEDGVLVTIADVTTMRTGTCGWAPTPAPPAPSYECKVEVSKDCCGYIALLDQPVNDLILADTECDNKKDKSAIYDNAVCEEVKLDSCNNEEDIALWKGTDGKQCQRHLDSAALDPPGCVIAKPPNPSADVDCLEKYLTSPEIGYTPACSRTIGKMIACGASVSMKCATSCVKPSSNSCQSCIQEKMIQYCVNNFKTESGIEACPSKDFGKLYDVAMPRIMESVTSMAMATCGAVALVGLLMVAVVRRRLFPRIPADATPLVEGHE